MDQSLEQAIEELRGGNQQGFQIIYDQTHNYVFSQARMLLRNEADANDLVQEVYINAYNSIHSLQDNQKIFSWLGGITFRQATKILRKQKDVLLQSEEDNLFEAIVELDPDVQPEQAVDKEYTENVIMELIEKLPPLQQGALTAFYYDEMSIHQIAEVYGCSENTIKSRLNYAKKSLKEQVLEKEKREHVKLHSVSPAIVIAALYQLFSKNTVSAKAAQTVYDGVVQELSLTGVSNVSGAAAIGKMAGTTARKASTVKTVITTLSTVVAITSTGGSIYMANKLHSLEQQHKKQTVQHIEQMNRLEDQLEQVQKELNSSTNEKKDLQEQLIETDELLQKEQEKVTELEEKKAEEEKQQALEQEQKKKQKEQKKSENLQNNSNSQNAKTSEKATEEASEKNDTSQEENPFSLDSPEELEVNLDD